MNKQEVMAKVALTEKDTGSPEVQVALLTAHINELNEPSICVATTWDGWMPSQISPIIS